MEIEILKKFCGTDFPEWIKTPFNMDDYSIATDGHVIVRVISSSHGQGIALPPILGERETAMIKKLPWSTLKKRSQFRLRPEKFAAAREHFLCQYCFPGAPMAGPCPECKGKDSDDCSTCEGSGVKKTDSGAWNTIQCPECGGTRWHGAVVWLLRYDPELNKCYELNPKILQKMLDVLGVIELTAPPEQGPVGFRFDGGDGLLMPMRSASWKKIANMESGEKKITAICNECGRVWEAPVILGMVTCTECGSENVSVAIRKDKTRQD